MNNANKQKIKKEIANLSGSIKDAVRDKAPSIEVVIEDITYDIIRQLDRVEALSEIKRRERIETEYQEISKATRKELIKQIKEMGEVLCEEYNKKD